MINQGSSRPTHLRPELKACNVLGVPNHEPAATINQLIRRFDVKRWFKHSCALGQVFAVKGNMAQPSTECPPLRPNPS